MSKKFISVSIIFAVMIKAVVAQTNDLSEPWETGTDFIFLNHLEEAQDFYHMILCLIQTLYKNTL